MFSCARPCFCHNQVSGVSLEYRLPRHPVAEFRSRPLTGTDHGAKFSSLPVLRLHAQTGQPAGAERSLEVVTAYRTVQIKDFACDE